MVLASHSWNPVLTKIKRNANFSVADWVMEQESYWMPTLLEGKKVNYYDLFKDRDDFNYDKTYPMDHLMDGYMDKSELDEMANIRIKSIARYLSVPGKKSAPSPMKNAMLIIPIGESLIVMKSFASLPRALAITRMGQFQGCLRKDEWNCTTRENHIGHIYQYITLLLGMKPNQHEYKVMGSLRMRLTTRLKRHMMC